MHKLAALVPSINIRRRVYFGSAEHRMQLLHNLLMTQPLISSWKFLLRLFDYIKCWIFSCSKNSTNTRYARRSFSLRHLTHNKCWISYSVFWAVLRAPQTVFSTWKFHQRLFEAPTNVVTNQSAKILFSSSECSCSLQFSSKMDTMFYRMLHVISCNSKNNFIVRYFSLEYSCSCSNTIYCVSAFSTEK